MAWKQYPEAAKRGDENGNVEELIGNVWTRIISGGRWHINISGVGPTEQSRNRLRTGLDVTYAAATNSATWEAADNITEISVLITATDTATAPPPSTENYVLLAFNAGSDALAAAWLTEADSASADAQFEKVLIGERAIFRFNSALVRLDALPVNIGTTSDNTYHMHVGAS